MELNDQNIQKLTALEFKGHTSSKHHNASSVIYYDSEYIYKIVDSKLFFPKQFERNIEYLINNPLPNSPRIYEKILMDGEFYGYVTEYIKDGLTFREALNSDLTEQDRAKAIIDIHECLKTLHANNITIGDIHLDNLLIQENKGYIVDLDYMRFKGEEKLFNSCYDIKQKNNLDKITEASVYSDITKIMLLSLSLLIKMNLESLVNNLDKSIHLENIFDIVIQSTHNNKLINYFERVMNGEAIYFDDFLIENGYYKSNKISIH